MDEEVDGPGDCGLDFESLLVKTEKRELASLWQLNGGEVIALRVSV